MSNNSKTNNEIYTCAICLTNIRNINTNNIIKQSCCNKPFHKKCINKWYKIKKECPLCRKKHSLFNDDELNFLSNTLTNIAPLLRPLYRTYNIDSTMQNATNVLSLFENNINNLRDIEPELNNEFESLDEVFNSTRNIIETFRNIMNND